MKLSAVAQNAILHVQRAENFLTGPHRILYKFLAALLVRSGTVRHNKYLSLRESYVVNYIKDFAESICKEFDLP